MQVGEDVEHRLSRGVERRLVARPVAVALALEVEPGVPVERVHQRGELLGGPGPVDDEPLVPQPAHHVQVDHRQQPAQRIDRVLHVVRRAQQPQLLAAERDEEHGARRGLPGEAAGQLDQHGGARGVVVGTVVHLAAAVRVERAEAPQTQVVVVGPDDHGLVPEHRVVAGEEPDDVLGAEPAHVGMLRHRGLLGHGEGLEPASGGGLEPDLLEPARQVRRGGIRPLGSGHPSPEAVIAQEADVVEGRDGRRLGAGWRGRERAELGARARRRRQRRQERPADTQPSHLHMAQRYHPGTTGERSRCRGPGGGQRRPAAGRCGRGPPVPPSRSGCACTGWARRPAPSPPRGGR